MPNIIASGDFWALDSDGLLDIFCQGNMPNYTYDTISKRPWHNLTVITLTLQSSVTSVGNYAFNGCADLTSVAMPNSVTSIGLRAFSACGNLSNVIMSENVMSIGSMAFYNCAFANILIPNGVTSIGNNAFNKCVNLASATIPGSVTSINNGTFENCSSLANVTMPNSVTSIGNNAFRYCNSLTDVYYGGTEEQWNAITIGSGNDPLVSSNIHYNYVPVPTKALESIAITTQPTKTTYTTGETFDASGMVVTATYSDASTATVTGYTTSPTVALTTSDTVITVSYTEGDVTKTATVNITVTESESEPEPEPEPEPIAERRMITYNGSSKVARRLCELVSDLYAAPRLFVDAEGYISVVYQEGNDGD